MSLLSLFGSGRQASSNRPDWLVRNDDIRPIFLCEIIGIRFDLRKHVIIGCTSLTSLKRLSTTGHDLESLVQGIFGLSRNLIITLSLPSAFGVSNAYPSYAHILEHIGRGLTGVSTISLNPAVLCTDGNIRSEFFGDALYIHRRWAYDNLGIGAEGGLIQHGDEVVDLTDGTIALPVSADKEFSCFSASRGVKGAGASLCSHRCKRTC
mmetsp:Transcript_26257/g.30986  ORF Transcript_26257/g.30986 Transcript_26257/m.30986 type:complete len:208 (+) Transcript_26257:439-1062(+)